MCSDRWITGSGSNCLCTLNSWLYVPADYWESHCCLIQTLGPISNSLSQSTWSKQTTGKSKYKYHGHSIGKSQYLIIKSKYSSPYTGTSDTGIQILFR